MNQAGVQGGPGSANESPGQAGLRIAFFVTYFPKVSEIFLVHQALELERRGHRVTFVALASAEESLRQPAAASFLSSGARVAGMPRRTLRRLAGLPHLLRQVGLAGTVKGLDWRRYGEEATSLRALYRLGQVMSGPLDEDVIHAQFGNVARQCVLLRDQGLLPMPLVTSFRGNDLSGYLRGARRDVYASVFRTSVACLPVAERWRDTLEDLGCPAEKIQTMPSGIALDRIPERRSVPTGDTLRLVSAARLEPHKGLHLGLDAFRRIRQAVPGATYDIVGDGPERTRLEARARALGVGDHVRWHGHAAHDDVLRLFGECHLHLFTTMTVRNRTEGVPNVLKETQATGLPAVAFAHPGVEEVVVDGETGFIVPEGDVEAMADRAVRFGHTPQLVTEVGERASRRTRARFDIRGITDRLEAVYRRAVEECAA